MKKLLIPALMIAVLGACASVSSVPEMQARSAWTGLPVRDVIDNLGIPDTLSHDTEKQWVILTYGHDTSYVAREALGTYTGPANGQLVHAEYWGDVKRTRSCEVRVAIDRDRKVADYRTRGGNCGAVIAKPKTRN